MHANDLILLCILVLGTLYVNWNIIRRDLFQTSPPSDSDNGFVPPSGYRTNLPHQ